MQCCPFKRIQRSLSSTGFANLNLNSTNDIVANICQSIKGSISTFQIWLVISSCHRVLICYFAVRIVSSFVTWLLPIFRQRSAMKKSDNQEIIWVVHNSFFTFWEFLWLFQCWWKPAAIQLVAIIKMHL